MAAYLTLNGTPIPVLYEPSEAEIIEVGDGGYSTTATYLSSIDVRKEDVPLRTPYLKEAEFETVLAVLRAPPPVAVGGDMKTFTAAVTVVSKQFITYNGEVWGAASFLLRQT